MISENAFCRLSLSIIILLNLTKRYINLFTRSCHLGQLICRGSHSACCFFNHQSPSSEMSLAVCAKISAQLTIPRFLFEEAWSRPYSIIVNLIHLKCSILNLHNCFFCLRSRSRPLKLASHCPVFKCLTDTFLKLSSTVSHYTLL